MSSIRVMTYNVRYFGHALPFRGATSTRKALSAVTRAMAFLDSLPEVICLQEVEARSLRSRLSHSPKRLEETQLQALMKVLDDHLQELGSPHSYRSFYFPAHAYRIGKAHMYTTGLATLVRDDVLVMTHNAGEPYDVTHRRKSPLGRMKQSRVCGHIHVIAKNKGYDIFNTHLSLPTFLSTKLLKKGGRMGYGDNQAREVEALAEYVDVKRRSDRYLIMGDFNSLPGSPAYTRLLARLNVSDTFADHVRQSPEELRVAWPTAGFLHLRMRLDHVFAGPGVKFLDFSGTHPFGHRNGYWHGLSDHVPILGRATAVV